MKKNIAIHSRARARRLAEEKKKGKQ